MDSSINNFIIRAIQQRLHLQQNAQPQNKGLVYLQSIIAVIDDLLSEQLCQILHHQKLQQLEASWSGLLTIASQLKLNDKIKIRILNVSAESLSLDVKSALDYEHSYLYCKIYNETFDMPGGEPFGLLLGDYALHHSGEVNVNCLDLNALQLIAKIGAATFVPFLLTMHWHYLGIDDLEKINLYNLEKYFLNDVYKQWHQFRRQEEAAFIGLVIPRVLSRLPHTPTSSRSCGFQFNETPYIKSLNDYTWCNPIYAFGQVVMRSFELTGWLMEILGSEDTLANGIISELPRESFHLEKNNFANKCLTEICVTEHEERMLNTLGFIPLCERQYTSSNAFYSCNSAYDLDSENSLSVSPRINYLLCLNRIAHYVKVLMRDKIGLFMTPKECQDYLQGWIATYTSPGEISSQDLHRYPIKKSDLIVREVVGHPGKFQCNIEIELHTYHPLIEGGDLQFNLLI